MLIQELEPLFSDVDRPVRAQLGVAEMKEEWEWSLDRLYSKTWQDVTIDDFFSPDGDLETVTALSAQGISYFIPGLMRLALEEEGNGMKYSIVDALLMIFTGPSNQTPDAEGEATLARLSDDKRNFIIRFLEEMSSTVEYICPVIITSAIESLQTGNFCRYKQKAVREWSDEEVKKIEKGSADNI